MSIKSICMLFYNYLIQQFVLPIYSFVLMPMLVDADLRQHRPRQHHRLCRLWTGGEHGGNPAPLRRRIHRANVLKHATTWPASTRLIFSTASISATADDYTPMKTLYISIFNGKDWDISTSR